MAGKYHDLAADILKNVGGLANVESLTHCITRLRFRLKDEGKADKEVLEGLDGVIQVMQAGGQYQVVVGAKVDDLYEELLGAMTCTRSCWASSRCRVSVRSTPTRTMPPLPTAVRRRARLRHL